MPSSAATCATISWSISFHERRFARRAAISPPPLPYSREMVIARIVGAAVDWSPPDVVGAASGPVSLMFAPPSWLPRIAREQTSRRHTSYLVTRQIPVRQSRAASSKRCHRERTEQARLRLPTSSALIYPFDHALGNALDRLLVRCARRQCAEDCGAIHSRLQPAVKEHDGVALAVAPCESPKRLAQPERGMGHDKLILLVRPCIGASGQQRIAHRGERHTRDDDTGGRLIGLAGALPERPGAQQHDTRLIAKRLPELTSGTVLALGEYKDILALQLAPDALRAGTERGV